MQWQISEFEYEKSERGKQSEVNWYWESGGKRHIKHCSKLNMDEAFLVHFRVDYTVHKNTMMHNASIGTIEKNIIRYVAFNCALNAKKLRALRFSIGMLTHTYSHRNDMILHGCTLFCTWNGSRLDRAICIWQVSEWVVGTKAIVTIRKFNWILFRSFISFFFFSTF